MEIIFIAMLIVIGLITVLLYRTQWPSIFNDSRSRGSHNGVEKVWLDVPERPGSEAIITIAGSYWKGSSKRGLLLLHMMPATKESWNELAEIFHNRGYHVLAIDLRGHGESTQRQEGDTTSQVHFNDFSDAQHHHSINDVATAHEWLRKQGVANKKLTLGGASIGANLAFEYLSNHKSIPAAFLLSPGVNYHGIHTDVAVQEMGKNQRVMLVAGENDHTSSQSIRQLHAMRPEQTFLHLVISSAHGTALLTERPSIIQTLIEFIENTGTFDPKIPHDNLFAEYK